MLELHTLGAEHYLGNQLPGDINPWPGSPSIPEGYVDNDIYEVMKCFTGWRVNDHSDFGDTGEFLYHDPWHDRTGKTVLSFGFQNIPANQGPEVDGLQVLDMLATHPGTARHIATKMARRLLSDDPPEWIIAHAAQTFLDEINNPNQLREVARSICMSMLDPNFDVDVPWGSKIRRPFELLAASMRACRLNYTIRPDDSESNSFWYRFDDTGQEPFNHRPPDGYPDKRSAWQGSNTMMNSLRTLDWMLDENATSDDPVWVPVLQNTIDDWPNGVDLTPDSIADFWLTRILGFTPAGGTWLGTSTHDAIARFFAQTYAGAEFPWPRNKVPLTLQQLQTEDHPYRWHRRLRGMIALILSSPNFMQR